MKKIIFSILAIAAVVSLSSCTKHKMHFDVTELPDDVAEFQLIYMEPVTTAAANNIDSVFVNGQLYSNSKGSGTLYPYSGIPYNSGNTNTHTWFFAANAGSNHFQFYRGENIIYDQNITLKKGKQCVIFYDLTKDPIIIELQTPYWADRYNGVTVSGATWNTDSVIKLQFINLLFETPGVPYVGTLQYQYKRSGNILDPITGAVIGPEPEVWYNMGEPVAFGETTGFQMVVVHKQTFNSSGNQRLDYRILTETGDELMKWNGSRMVKYTDYWNGYIGRVYMHFFRGNRTVSPVCNVTQWTLL
jgi:hypothetical protein